MTHGEKSESKTRLIKKYQTQSEVNGSDCLRH